jgi:hypothetical protein
MSKKRGLLIFAIFFLFFSVIFYLSQARSAKETIPAGEAACYECHEVIKSLKVGNKHAPLPCSTCHTKLTEHLRTRKTPVTNLELTLCGKCPPLSMKPSSVNFKSKAKVEKAATTSRSPTFDKLMALKLYKRT